MYNGMVVYDTLEYMFLSLGGLKDYTRICCLHTPLKLRVK